MIRNGTATDLTSIDPWDPFGGSRAAEIAEQRMRVFENPYSREAAGYLSVAADSFHGNPYIEFICVSPSQRREGIATALFEDTEARFVGRRIFTSVEEANDPMLALLRRRGYRFSGSLGGLNDDHGGAAELFFYRDVPST